jgi:N-acetylglucosamine kinase-like BadF-type ATPase
MAYFLAIDAGGTKTDFVLADETRVLARHRTGTIKRLRTDTDTALQNLDAGLAELTAASGVAMSSVLRTCIGTAGESVPLVADWLRHTVAERVGGSLLLLGDVEIALDAAFRGGPGVLVLAGTGSNVAGRTPSGAMATAGGWGPMLADQGSGHAIGANALRAIFLSIDEGRTTKLQEAVLEFWDLASIDLLVEHANRTPTPDVSRLTYLVLACAESGDALAQEVLRTEGEQLAYLVRLLIRRLRILQGDATFVPPLAFAGSIMERVAPVRNALVAALREEFPQLQASAGVVDPIEGALWRARDEQAFNARAKAVEQDASRVIYEDAQTQNA